MGKNFLNGKISWKEKLIEIMNFRKLEISWKYGDGQFFSDKKIISKIDWFFSAKKSHQTNRQIEWMNEWSFDRTETFQLKEIYRETFFFRGNFPMNKKSKKPKNQNEIQKKNLKFHFFLSRFFFHSIRLWFT